MIEFTLKDYKNIDPNTLQLEPLYQVTKENFYTKNSDLWGSLFLFNTSNNCLLFDFNLVSLLKDVKTISIYLVTEGEIQTDKYITWLLKEIKNKERSYKNLNKSEYLKR